MLLCFTFDTITHFTIVCQALLQKSAIYFAAFNFVFLQIEKAQHFCCAFLEQVKGVEPSSSAWKADVLAVVRHLHSTVFYIIISLWTNVNT